MKEFPYSLKNRVEISGTFGEENFPWMASIVESQTGKRSAAEWFLLDTGSRKTFITPEVANDIGLEFDPKKTETVNFIFGGEKGEGEDIKCTVVEASLWFAGKMIRKNLPIYVKIPASLYIFDPEHYEKSQFFRNMPPILGTEVMLKFREVRFDKAKGKIRLITSRFGNKLFYFSTRSPILDKRN